MQVYAIENPKTGLWELCKKHHHTCCEMNASTAAAYNAGKNLTMRNAYEFLGRDAVFFKTSDYLIGHGQTPLDLNKSITKQLRTKPYVHVSLGDQTSVCLAHHV